MLKIVRPSTFLSNSHFLVLKLFHLLPFNLSLCGKRSEALFWWEVMLHGQWFLEIWRQRLEVTSVTLVVAKHWKPACPHGRYCHPVKIQFNALLLISLFLWLYFLVGDGRAVLISRRYKLSKLSRVYNLFSLESRSFDSRRSHHNSEESRYKRKLRGKKHD